VLRFCYLHKACDASGFQLALNGHRCLISIPVIRYDAAVVATGPELFDGRLPSPPSTQSRHSSVGPAGRLRDKGSHPMTYITTHDGTRIFYKDWGLRDAQPIVFHHGWPLSADDWDNQMMFFLAEGYRVIAHDRRGHGRSDQTDDGNEMDTYAADVAELVTALDLKNAIHIGHSTGGGEVAHYVARAEPGRVAKAVLIDAVPPVMVKNDSNPGGTPIEVFDGFRAALAGNRAQFYLDIPSGPFYGFNRPGAKVSEGLIRNWWRQAMMGSVKAGYECIKAFSETDFTEDLKAIDVPLLVIHSEDDQIVPYADSAPLTVKLLKNGTLKTYKDLPHGLCQTHPEIVNPEILAFIRGQDAKAGRQAA
jgi:non-heme chloroperoxidase